MSNTIMVHHNTQCKRNVVLLFRPMSKECLVTLLVGGLSNAEIHLDGTPVRASCKLLISQLS